MQKFKAKISSSKNLPQLKMNLVDRAIGFFNPGKAVQRLKARASLTYFENSGFITPGSTKRTMRGWNAYSGTADGDIIPKLEAMRDGSRDLVMNSPLASAPLNREVTNSVGWGLTLQSRIDREYLGISDEEADRWERNVEREFRLWSNSKDCDATRSQNFYELQASALYNTSLSGDVFILLPFIPRKMSPYNLAIKMVEADLIANPHTLIQNQNHAGGIEVDKDGAPIRYWMKILGVNHLLGAGYNTVTDFKPIQAFGSRTGRRNVLHLFHKKRPGQRRGTPMLAPVMELLKQLSRLTEAELAASVINSFFTVFIKTDASSGGLQDGFVPEQQYTEQNELQGDEKIYEMASGNILELGEEGQSIDIADPKRPNSQFEPFFLALVKQIGSCLEIPFEQLILHFSSSYSASRAALLEAWKFYRMRRMWVSQNFCKPIFEEWLTEAITMGRISAPGFLADPGIRAAWSNSVWVGPGQGQIDPLKETKAAELRLKTKLTDHESEYAQIHGGGDWEKSMNRLAHEKDFLEGKGLSADGVAQDNQSIQDQLQDIEDTGN